MRLRSRDLAPFATVDASNTSSLGNNPPDGTVTVKESETQNASPPSKHTKTEVHSPANANTSQQDRRPEPKNVKGRRGQLKQMVEMPLDTLHEIFRELEPIDLLHLSWASKSLNTILMEKPSRYIWEEVGQFLASCHLQRYVELFITGV